MNIEKANAEATERMMEARPVLVGLSNDKFIEIKDGVSEGDEVVLNPRSVFPELHEEQRQEQTVDVSKRFGEAPSQSVKPPAQALPAIRRSPGVIKLANRPDLPVVIANRLRAK